jgi:hypothetical protein
LPAIIQSSELTKFFVEHPLMKTALSTLTLALIASISMSSAAFADNFSPDPNSLNYTPPMAQANATDFDLSPVQQAQVQVVANNVGVGGGGGGTTGANSGSEGNQSYKTNEAPAQRTYGNSAVTGQQYAAFTPTWTTQLDKVYGNGKPLPPTSMESFVANAAGMADLIYGDEGSTSIPPFFGFDESHRINAGIYSNLTTGHASALPEAWGYPN